MTLDEFIDKYNSQPMNYDGKYGNQCIDLFRFYVQEVLQLPQFPAVKWARDLWTLSPRDYTKIKNTPWNVPQKGDIVIFDNHVSVFVSGNVLWFTSFDQNFPSQGYYDKSGNFIGTGVAHLQRHNYLSPKVLGWFRKK